MKKIQTAELVAKKQKRNQIVMGVILVALLVVSTAGFSLMSSKDGDKNSYKENGINFFRQNGVWVAEIGGETFGFQYLPSEVENISVRNNFDLGDYVDKPLYFVGQSGGIPEVLGVLGRYASRYQEACLENISCGGDFPVKDCTDNLIIFEEGNPEVYAEENCVYLRGDPLHASDAFLYEVLKIR
jgi:hypothetical protein